MKKLAILTAAAALAAVPALAQPYYAGSANHGQYHGAYPVPPAPYNGPGVPYAAPYGDREITTGSVVQAPGPDIAPSAERFSLNPAADGNANLQTRPVPNYGNVSGGYRAAE